MRIVRIAGVLIALAVCAWFVLGLRQAQETAKATAIASATTPLTASQIKQAGDLLHAAKALNPDTEVDLLRAQLDWHQNHLPAARAILRRVVASEPDNAVAWVWLARSSRGAPRAFARALLRVRQLAPPVPPPH